jgi:hypothetical protein
MARTTFRKVNAALQAAGFEGVELDVRGDGDLYFTGGDTPRWYQTAYTVSLSALTVEQWVDEARTLARWGDEARALQAERKVRGEWTAAEGPPPLRDLAMRVLNAVDVGEFESAAESLAHEVLAAADDADAREDAS